MSARRELLRLLGEMPFLDRLEAAAVSGWSRGAVYAAIGALEEGGLAASLPHASELIAPTRRYTLTAAGLRRLAAEEGIGLRELLYSRPLTAHSRRLLLERLDAVAVIYRLSAAITGPAWPLRFRWYRALPMDAAVALPDGRSVFVVRQGPTAERTAFAKRLWRLREGPRPGAYLLLVPDEVRLRHTARLMARASAPTFLALERDATASGAGARVWRSAAGSPPLSLQEVLSHIAEGGAWPEEEPLARAAVPRDLLAAGASSAHDWMLPALLKPTEKRVLGLIADWPWISPARVATMLGLGRSRLSETLQRLDDLDLLAAAGGGTRRLAPGDRALAVLARRDRSAANLARKRWSAAPHDPATPLTWRNVTGRRSRQLLRNLPHSEAVHGFLAALAAQARASGTEVVQLDPPHRASRYFPHGDRLHSVQPDAFAILRLGGRARPCFLEWEHRAVHPSTMAARLAPYVRYYASQRPTDDHGLRPTLLVVFGDDLAAHHFLGVAQREIARARVDLPLLVSSARTLREAGPLGEAWGAPGWSLRLAALLPPDSTGGGPTGPLSKL